MKIQSLAIIFIVIILPISLVLASYTQSRVQTLSIQARYDSKLNDATYDALKAYQLNSLNSNTSDYVNSKMRDIQASVNTFFNTMSTGFSTLGYSKTTLQNYVPALVYTMYDGYYIYSPYANIWDEETIDRHESDTSFNGTTIDDSNKERLYGLKPYVYYSCRYKKSDLDITITYSLDNYIQIQGYVEQGGMKKTVSKSGYLLSDVVVNGDNVTYKGISIDTEQALTENIFYIDTDGSYKERNLRYKKINGTKYYTDGTKVFSILNGKAMLQTNISVTEINNNNNAKEYYKKAYELKQFITTYLSDLETSDIVNTTGNNYYSVSGKIFDFNYSEGIESETSNFNTHRIDVIKNSIERNLSIAISNFNNYSGVTTDFQMPKLTDIDWDKITENISIISFLQGINIGGKIYNGYSIIANTENEDIVMEDSIYIQTKDDNTVHRVTEAGLDNQDVSNLTGIFNINLERRTIEDNNGTIKYYFPVYAILSYDSIITQTKIAKTSEQSLKEYIDTLDEGLRKVYYTTLGRERYGLYRKILEI